MKSNHLMALALGSFHILAPMASFAETQPAQKIDQNFVITRTSEAEGFREIPLAGIVVYPDHRNRLSQSAPQPPSRGAGVHVLEGLTPPEADALRAKLHARLGKPASFVDLEQISQIILEHYRKHDRPMTHVYLPRQSYGNVISFAVVEGRVGNISVISESDLRRRDSSTYSPIEASFAQRMSEKSGWQSWYQDPYDSKALKAQVNPWLKALKGRPLNTVEISTQMAALNRSPWARLNRPDGHPFRDVDVVFAPPGDDVIGQTDLIFEIRDSRPLRFFAGWENNLTEVLGDDRFFFGAVWYDAFMAGLNHQMAIQLFSAADPKDMSGISASYLIPWSGQKQFTELYAAYAESSSSVQIGGVPAGVDGTNLLLGGRHYFQLPSLFDSPGENRPLTRQDNPYEWADAKRERFGYHHEVGFGLDYKSIGNDLAFGGATVLKNPGDIFQFVAEYNARQTDPTGETTLALQAFYSPGGITGNNDDASFAPLRFNASAEYFYTKLRLEREQDLPYGMLAKASLTGQWADGNLLASEQIGLGGYGTVRGYKERVHRGDRGCFMNFELYSPVFSPCQDWFRISHVDSLRFLVFYDVGYASSVDSNPGDPLDGSRTLMSVGAGLRYEFDNTLRLRLDYGHQLRDANPAANTKGGGAVHFSALWSF